VKEDEMGLPTETADAEHIEILNLSIETMIQISHLLYALASSPVPIEPESLEILAERSLHSATTCRFASQKIIRGEE
jgi:hypothetical protein